MRLVKLVRLGVAGLVSLTPIAFALTSPPPKTNSSAEASVPMANTVVKPSLYVLGPEDQVMIQGPNADDVVGKPWRIDGRGDVLLPLLGSLHAGGLTVREFESVLNQRASSFIRAPQLVVTVVEFRSQPVSVVGAVNQPGIHQIEGHKTLVEMISLAGGLRADAGSTIHLTRSEGRLPLFGEHLDATGKYSMADVKLRDITSGARPDEDIQILPHDVIAVSKAGSIYVIGEVNKPGGFLLGDENSMSIVQAVSLAQGAEKTANLKKVLIIRNSQSPTKRQEISCDLDKIIHGKAEDISLQAQDILYVPGSTGKKVALRALETAITTGSGIAIWGMRP